MDGPGVWRWLVKIERHTNEAGCSFAEPVQSSDRPANAEELRQREDPRTWTRHSESCWIPRKPASRSLAKHLRGDVSMAMTGCPHSRHSDLYSRKACPHPIQIGKCTKAEARPTVTSASMPFA